ncbi:MULTISPECIES: tRNA (N6-isopentenyl adenosine(37)-C2)-methylthiotransferase MiaB [unclassified Arcicella]|uniref:tRNA (N6-isopentenyl adenosine(37)-C2)-methylthiotransferase MiaB n=1 Tax=unclassified Arcicella TaxID=2644986 RepID=UPI00285675A3|nr:MULTISPECIES: tRNA (N6-isopentenyl adenosine(37)-C2)-methylthiotransferase MiaB [unclassified Arcicella]MDR6562598.1 tRNA-2-methylthio-N6-dimethylallyladenosine synthase [Arcicella sp. BE51]MDR6812685.1 tRNA-2-methylthio-N6-dimethylallyladenosine synthase [Arcicella sp. BE140]MDR6823997.1 tRNA-2-methylthio-N6-dimethylallyladenosine synthase [Arcicella sp. BE139]
MRNLEILTEEDKETLDLPRTTIDEIGKQNKKKLYIESYGCQMNFSDSEIVTSILQENGYATTSQFEEADVILVNTCAIRENAEQKVRNRLKNFTHIKRKRPNLVVGVLGCMAERLKTKFLEEEKIVDIVAGPDSYRDLPNLFEEVEEGNKAINVFLSKEETYADISPVRLNSNGVTAFVSIMRGCDNMCSFCVVPFTRGRERSRDVYSILKECQDLLDNGYKEVTLLGQNVDSYKWASADGSETVNFAQLLERVALINPLLRVRFSTSHPKDITDEVLYTMKKYENICNYIHLPAQSGSSRILKLMNRTYDRACYINRVDKIREILGEECGISQDIIAGFCSETEEEHQETLSLIEYVRYDYGYMFSYSERPGTPAAKKLVDDIPEDVKQRRLAEIIALQRQISLERNQMSVGTIQKVLIEGDSKRSEDFLQGRNDQNKMVILPKGNHKKGDYVNVKITSCSSATLFGDVV